MNDALLIRAEHPADCAAIRFIHEQAFGRRDEADLVDRLRDEQVTVASLVAEMDGNVVGHLLFTRMWIDTANRSIPAVALAPLAVLPRFQRQRIGGWLIEHGLDELRAGSEKIVIVLGSAGYYSRFGFSCENARLLECPFRRESFLALELKPHALENLRAKVRYAKAFGL